MKKLVYKLYRELVGYISIAAIVLGASGCIKAGPDYVRPAPAIAIPETYQHKQLKPEEQLLKDKWWEVFGDPELNKLIENVLKNNLDIKKAAAIVLEVKSQFVQTRADRFPVLGIRGDANRQHKIVSLFMGGSQFKTIDTYNLSLPASFELDIWGRLARAEEASLANLLMVEENRVVVLQTVMAEAVNLYLQMESIERRIQVKQKSIDNYKQSLRFIQARYKRGLSSALAVFQTRRALSQAESELPAIELDLGIIQQRLGVLAGHYPKTSIPRHQPEDYFNRLSSVPAGLPSDLLTRRPDIRKAEASLKALSAGIGVAKASRFPRITLTGSMGYSSDALHNLFRPSSELWNIAAGFTQPLFDAGKLKANQKAAEARYKQGVVDYSRTILTAFAEMESALLTRKKQVEKRKGVLSFLRESKSTQKTAENRYRKGLVDYLTVLETMQTRYLAEEKLIAADLAILINRINLHRALGGGWGKIDK